MYIFDLVKNQLYKSLPRFYSLVGKGGLSGGPYLSSTPYLLAVTGSSPSTQL